MFKLFNLQAPLFEQFDRQPVMSWPGKLRMDRSREGLLFASEAIGSAELLEDIELKKFDTAFKVTASAPVKKIKYILVVLYIIYIVLPNLQNVIYFQWVGFL